MKIQVFIKSTEYHASGSYDLDKETFTVFKGAQFRRNVVESLKSHPYYAKRVEFIKKGYLSKDFILLNDHEFSNPSLASSLIQGRPSNGRKDWKLEDGSMLEDHINQDVSLVSEEEKLNYILDFLKNIDDLDQVNDQLGFNVFKTLNIINTEIRHSNVIAWLIDPNETHQLKDQFFKQLIRKIYLDNQDHFKSMDLEQIFLWDFNDITVYREKDHIDILVVDDKNKIVIAIENKVKSTEHSNQLVRYRDIIEKNFPKDDFRHIFVYLTVNEEEASDEVWVSFSYKDLLEVIERVKPNLKEKVLLFIEDYLEIVRKEIMPNEKLEKLCVDIYKKHKYALDLIYQYKPDEISNISDALIQLIEENDSYKLNHSVKNYIRFSTSTLDQLNQLYRKVAGSWVKEQAVILYEIRVNNKQIGLSIIVGPTTDDSRNEIIEYYKTKSKENIKESIKWTSLKSINLLSIKSLEDTNAIIDKIETKFSEFVSKFVMEIDNLFKDYNKHIKS